MVEMKKKFESLVSSRVSRWETLLRLIEIEREAVSREVFKDYTFISHFLKKNHVVDMEIIKILLQEMKKAVYRFTEEMSPCVPLDTDLLKRIAIVEGKLDVLQQQISLELTEDGE